MALNFQNNQPDTQTDSNNLSKSQTRDYKFMGNLPERASRPIFTNYEYKSNSDLYQEIEQKIAELFDKKDLIGLIEMLCIATESPFYIRKAKNSPLYVYFCGTRDELNPEIKEKMGLAETAVFLLLQDQEVSLKDIATAYNIFIQKNSVYQPPYKLTEEFQKRLGLFENIRKTDEIINKLKQAKQNLGYFN